MTSPRLVAELTYEQARDELIAIVGTLEAGTDSLEESMELWERGEELAAHCEAFLTSAREKLQRTEAGDASDTAEEAE